MTEGAEYVAMAAVLDLQPRLPEEPPKGVCLCNTAWCQLGSGCIVVCLRQ